MIIDYYPDIEVIIKDDIGELRIVNLEVLLPFAYVSSVGKA